MVLLKSEQNLQIGQTAPDFYLKNVNGVYYSLESFKGAKALLIIFMCNHCPYVKPKIKVIKKLQERYKDRGLVVVGINSNESENYPEDSFENMQKISKDQGFNFLYLHDESQEVAKKYGAVCTPDPFLFDSNLKLAYHGRLDDALSPGTKPTRHDMAMAIEKVLNGERPTEEFLPSMGCSIKWKTQQ